MVDKVVTRSSGVKLWLMRSWRWVLLIVAEATFGVVLSIFPSLGTLPDNVVFGVVTRWVFGDDGATALKQFMVWVSGIVEPV